MTGKQEVITVAKRAATGIKTVPFQKLSRNGKRKHLILHHPSRASLVFQKDLVLEDRGCWCKYLFSTVTCHSRYAMRLRLYDCQ